MSTQNDANRGGASDIITTYQAGVAQAAAHRTLQKFCDEVLKQFGITKMQWLIIGTVLDAGEKGIRLTDLADKLGTTMSYITNAVNLMESRTILARAGNSTDARSKFITVSPDFAPKCTTIEQTLRAALRQSIYANIDPDAFRIYMQVLYQLGNVR